MFHARFILVPMSNIFSTFFGFTQARINQSSTLMNKIKQLKLLYIQFINNPIPDIPPRCTRFGAAMPSSSRNTSTMLPLIKVVDIPVKLKTVSWSRLLLTT